MLLDKKVVVVTGGAGLIGLEFSKSIIKNGGIPIIADINQKKISKAVKELSKLFSNDKFDSVKLDISSEKSLKKCVSYVSLKYGQIDALVNNAYPRNKNYGNKFLNIKYNDFVENLGMNLGGLIISSKIFSLYFLKQGYGNIINISSIYGVIPPKFEIYKNTKMTMPIEYAAIKSGVLHLTKYLAKYFSGKNIRVNAISPGGILNEQPKNFLKMYNKRCLNKGMLDTKDLSGAITFLLSNDSRYINGQNIIVDDGFTL